MTAAIAPWWDGLDSDYARALGEAITPEMLAPLSEMADRLEAVVPAVMEAVKVLEPIIVTHRDVGLNAPEEWPLEDEVYDALRDRTGFGRLIDIAFAIKYALEAEVY